MMLVYYGMIIVLIGYGVQELFDIFQVCGGIFYGVIIIVGGDGLWQLSEEELVIVCYQGEYVVKLVVKLYG